MFALRSLVLRMVVVVMAIIAVAGSGPGLRQTGNAMRLQEQQGGRLLQDSDTPSPSMSPTTDEADMMSLAPTPAASATEAPTAAPSSADDREIDSSSAASWTPSSALSPAAIFVGSLAAAVSLL